jgi:hypothetical protein
MSAISWEDALNISSSVSSKKNRIEFDDLFLRPKAPEEKNSNNQYCVKVLQRPIPYIQHWPNKVDEEGKRVDVAFFDAEFTNRNSRICHKTFVKDNNGRLVLDKNADCPWCKAGYNAQLKYMFNVYDRETKQVRICDVTAKVIDEIARIIKDAKLKENVVIKPEDWDEAVPDFIITASRKSGKNQWGSGTVEYSVTASRKEHSINKEIIEAIIAINGEEVEGVEEVSDYKKYLHQVDRWIAPTEVATEEDSEKKSTHNLDVDEDDEDALLRSKKKSPKPDLSHSQNTKKKVEVEDEDEEETFSDDDSW